MHYDAVSPAPSGPRYAVQERGSPVSTSSPSPRPLLRIVVPVCFLVLGTGAMSWIAADAAARMRSSLFHASAPGETTWMLPEAGAYTLYLEYPKEQPGEASQAVEQLEIALRAAASEERIPVSIEWSAQRYAIGERAGAAIGAFDIPAPGAYVLSARYLDGEEEGPELTLSAAKRLLGRMMNRVYVGQGVMAAGVLGAALSFVLLRPRA